MSRGSVLDQLPAEILVSIAAFLPKSSVNSLSQTCKKLQDILERPLYATLDFKLDRTWFETSGLGGLLAASPVGLRWTSALTLHISNRVLCNGNIPAPIDDGEEWDEDSPSARLGHDINKLGKCSCSRLWKLATLFQLLIEKLPKQTMKSFRWSHVTRISPHTLALMFKLHGQSLQQLELLGPFDFGPDLHIGPLPQLRVLEISDADSGAEDAATRLLAMTRLALNKIKLGHETSNALPYLFPDLYQATNRSVRTQDFWHYLQSALQTQQDDVESDEEATEVITEEEATGSTSQKMRVILPALDVLHLIAMNAAVLLCIADKQPSIEAQTIYSLNQPLADISKLRSLTLESCKMPDWIDSLSVCARVKGPLRLEVFALREERITSSFPRKLDAFFGLFRGLKRISLLLEGDSSTLPVKNLITNHGESLRSLLIDQRLSARDSFGLSTHIRGSEDYKNETLLYLIGKGCPKLEQLGLSDFDLDGGVCLHRYVTMRTNLKNLRSLNFRVLPEQTKALVTPQDCEDAHEKVAAHFIRVYQRSLPKLTLIGTGSSTYKDIWLGRNGFGDGSTTFLEQYLCPRYFYVQRFTNIRGQQQPVLTKVAEGTPTGIDEYSPDTDIFQPYWIV